ncbi:DUF397 domain-containing protein [Streptomyces sp. 8N114]|uniref:DUF397 domain-containing protein n=1 Tax=Streptomyces sp. 8N114 TaxID=3457419 RepID=UPI003FD40B84
MTTEQKVTGGLSLAWVKSSYSGGGGGNCVEVARTGAAVHVRDSKVVGGPQLKVAPSGWSAFIERLLEGHDDHDH